MKVTTKGRYALRIMLDLAENNSGELTPLRDIAERQEISIKYMEQIIGVLSKAGYVKSSRGNSGGYKLARSPKEYRAGDVLRTMEGNLAVIACLEDPENECPRSGDCATLAFWQGLNRVIEDYVDSVTLEDMLRESAGGDRGDHGANV